MRDPSQFSINPKFCNKKPIHIAESISRGAMMARVLINFLIIIKIKTQIDCQNNFMEKMANILHIY
jgi:hypothetical protein